MKTQRIILFLTAILFISFHIPVISQTTAEKIDDLISKYYEYGLFNGSALVVEDGKVIFKKGYGVANYEWDVDNKPDTKFRIGSISKQFTATIIMQLVEEEKIKLDGKITDYLPNYRKDTGDKVTIHHLLTHTSGIISYTSIPNVWQDSLRNHYDKEYFIKHFHSSDLEFEPGEKFNYNNTGYYLLAAIVEEVTGKSFGEVLKERILEPAGMKNSGSEDDEFAIKKMASGYLKRGNRIAKDSYMYMLNAMGAGHMYSTVEDLFIWDQALYGNDFLSEESKEKMFTPFKSNYGYGWGIRYQKIGDTGDSTKIISHSGGINGFTTLIVRLVDDNNFIALFNNMGGSPRGEMAEQIGNILYGQEFDYPKRPIGDYLYQVINDEGIDNAVTVYNNLKEKDSTSYNFAENQLNILGYTLLREDRVNEAIVIFQLNIEAYPDAFNVYDSMGEAYMIKGENELAIKNYKKSLEINPANTGGIEMLKKLGVEYETKEVVVPVETLNKYIGEYELMPNFIITVRIENDKLMAQATGQSEHQIFPMTQTKFYYKVVNAQIEFIMNDNGEVEKLILYQAGKELPGKKIK